MSYFYFYNYLNCDLHRGNLNRIFSPPGAAAADGRQSIREERCMVFLPLFLVMSFSYLTLVGSFGSRYDPAISVAIQFCTYFTEDYADYIIISLFHANRFISSTYDYYYILCGKT